MTTTIARFLWLALGGCLLVGQAGAQDTLPLVWETAGFKNPESVAYDPKTNALYVSNVDGPPGRLDALGTIAKLNLDGKMENENWRINLSAPKGMGMAGDFMYVSDVDRLLQIHLERRFVANLYLGRGGKFFNDVAVADKGDVFVSDTATGVIWRLRAEKFEKWLIPDAINFCRPNGLVAEKDRLVVACWMRLGPDGKEGPGPLLSVSYKDKRIAPLGDGKPIGYLDGIQPDGSGGYYLSDWVDGALLHWTPQGGAEKIMDLESGTADFLYLRDKRLIIVPFMKDNVVGAYRAPKQQR
jgi:hypothetical protein